MNTSKEELINRSLDLVCLPSIYIKVQELLNDPKSSIEDFSQAVSHDPGLTAKILRIANSAFFGFATEIDSIKRAVSIMGTAQLHDLVLATSAIESFSGIPDEVEDMNTFWKRSIHTGVIAQLIGSKCNSLDHERFFVIGLLNNIGHLIFCLQEPKLICTAMEQSLEQNMPLAHIEKESFGFDYAELGSDLLSSWGLPQVFVESIRYHLHPDKADNFKLESSAVSIANNLSLEIYSQDQQHHADIPISAWNISGLEPNVIPSLKSEAKQHYQEAVNLLL